MKIAVTSLIFITYSIVVGFVSTKNTEKPLRCQHFFLNFQNILGILTENNDSFAGKWAEIPGFVPFIL